MSQGSGGELLLDDAALVAAARRFAPLVGELDAVLAEVDSIIADLRHDCSGHHTGAAFGLAQTRAAQVTELQLRATRAAVWEFSGDLARAAAEFGGLDATAAAGMETGRC